MAMGPSRFSLVLLAVLAGLSGAELRGSRATAPVVNASVSDVETAAAQANASALGGEMDSMALWGRGVCVGGSMCEGKRDPSSCETSIFGCKWKWSCPGYCSGSSMCTGMGESRCKNSIFGCNWKCNWWPQDGLCVGGSMCEGKKDASSCETSIFDCKWERSCPGYCSGSSMCRGKQESGCKNSIFDCQWKCNYWR